MAEPQNDRSLYYDDIQGARTKHLHPSRNHNFPNQEVYSQNVQNAQFGRHLYQDQMLSLPEQVAPLGLVYFQPGGRKHFQNQQRGEIDTYMGLQNLYDPPKRFPGDNDRSLATKDIEGAVTNTLISKVVKNKERAQVFQNADVSSQGKTKSFYEPNSKQQFQAEVETYKPRQLYLLEEQNGDLFKNRSALQLNTASIEDKQKYLEKLQRENKQQEQLIEFQQQQSQKYQQQILAQQQLQQQQNELQPQQYRQLSQSQGQQYFQSQQQQSQPSVHSQQSKQRYSQKLASEQSQLKQQTEQQYQQPLTQSLVQLPPIRAQQEQEQYEQARLSEQQRQQQYQSVMQKQWQDQNADNKYKEKYFEEQKQQELRQQQLITEQAKRKYEDSRRQEDLKKQQYAMELKQQVDQVRQASEKGRTPSNFPGTNKNEAIQRVLQGSTRAQVDSLQKEIESIDQRRLQMGGVNKYKEHEIQQYLFDLRSGKIPPGTKMNRNTPTFMSYAGANPYRSTQ